MLYYYYEISSQSNDFGPIGVTLEQLEQLWRSWSNSGAVGVTLEYNYGVQDERYSFIL